MPEQAFDAKTEARLLLREAGTAALGTLDEDGCPFVSLVTLATLPDATPIVLLSGLAVHTKNLERDPRASLLIAGGPRTIDPLTSPRVTLSGAARRSPDPDRAGRRFLSRHREAAGYARFKDFGFWEIALTRGHLVSGFGRIAGLDVADLLTRDATTLEEIEQGAIDHMTEDHSEAIRLYATRLLGEEDGNWRIIGIDPEGMELALKGRIRRLEFPERVDEPGRLRVVLKQLADRARAQD